MTKSNFWNLWSYLFSFYSPLKSRSNPIRGFEFHFDRFPYCKTTTLFNMFTYPLNYAPETKKQTERRLPPLFLLLTLIDAWGHCQQAGSGASLNVSCSRSRKPQLIRRKQKGGGVFGGAGGNGERREGDLSVSAKTALSQGPLTTPPASCHKDLKTSHTWHFFSSAFVFFYCFILLYFLCLSNLIYFHLLALYWCCNYVIFPQHGIN